MTDPNDPASPLIERNDSTGPIVNIWHLGLTKREWFAGMALQGLVANAENLKFFQQRPDIMATEARQETAKTAVQFADALIAELNKEPK